MTTHLIFGVDGADPDLIHSMGPEQLPNLFRWREEGTFAALQSVQPPATLPNWTTFLTGANPGRHGVFDFTTRKGYQVAFTGGTVRALPTWIRTLDDQGLRCACLGFPGTWPPEPLKHGVFISGWDSPVAFTADTSFVHPPELHKRITEKFGTIAFDDVNEFDAEQPGWHQRLPDQLCKRIWKRTELVQWILQQGPWDVVAVYFGETDTASHHLFSLHDPSSPRAPKGVRSHTESGLTQVYTAIDESLGRLANQVRAQKKSPVEITIVSDHGSGGASDKVLYLNRLLHEAGFLQWKSAGTTRWATRLKDAALTTLPPQVRQGLFRVAGKALPGWLESQNRFAAIDMAHTRAFSDELNYFPAIHLNIVGREPEGTLYPENVDAHVLELQTFLRSVRDPWTHKPVFRNVWKRQDLFHGPHVERAPDLLLDLHEDNGHTYNLQPSATAPVGTGPWRKLAETEYLGRKGRSLPGSHRPRGVFIAHGPTVEPCGEIDAHMVDAATTTLARIGLTHGMENLHSSAEGRVLWEALREITPMASKSQNHRPGVAPQGPSVQRNRLLGPEPSPTPQPNKSTAQPEKLEERMRALGYID